MSLHRSFLCLAAVVSLVLSSTVVYGQNYQSIKMDADALKLSRKGSSIKRSLKNGLSEPEDRQEFQQFFDKYYFPQMTQSSPQALGELGELRADLFKQFIWQAPPAIQKELTEKAFKFARGALGARFHPAVKYNAVLVLGDLDAQYAIESSANRRPPKPLPQANALLCRIVELSVKGQGNVAHSLQSAAMIGLKRHVKYFASLPTKEKQATAKALMAAVKQTKFPVEVDQEVRDWLRLQAAEAISLLGTPGRNGVFVNAVLEVAKDDKTSLENRCLGVSYLKNCGIKQQTPFDAKLAIETLKLLAAAVAKEERKVAKKFEDMQLRGGGQRDALRFLDAKRFRPGEEGIELVRVGIVSELKNLQRGIQAIAPVAGEEADALASLAGALQRGIASANDTKQVDLKVAADIKRMCSEIDSLVAPGADAGDSADETAELFSSTR